MSQADADDSDWRGTDEGGKLMERDTMHWESLNKGDTNSSGFSAILGGYRDYDCTFNSFSIYYF